MIISLLHLGRTDYATGLALQGTLVELRKQAKITNTLLLLEHPPVITFGRNSQQNNLVASREALESRGVELFDADRGGDVTFHGPGQLVAYPIFDLRSFEPRLGAVEFVRKLEEVVIRTCGDFGIPCERIAGLTGVWTQADPPLQPAKIAAIGVHISRGVTSHGLALNVTTDLEFFKLIVPCGIAGRPVTSMVEQLGDKTPAMDAVTEKLSLNFGRVFASQSLWLHSLDDLTSTVPEDLPARAPAELREVRGETDEYFLA